MNRHLRRMWNRTSGRATTRSNIAFQERSFVGLQSLEPRMMLSGDIFVTVINDVNGNGVKDHEEPELPNWRVFVDLNRNGNLDSGEPTGLTDQDGELFLVGLEEGSYSLRQVLQSGWSPSPGYSVQTEVQVIDDDEIEVFFLNSTAQIGAIEGTVWSDLNGDGYRDAEDPGLAGWVVFIDLNNNKALDGLEPSTTTDADGYFYFSGLAPDEYRVREILPPGWEPTLGYDVNTQVEVIAGGIAFADFGNFTASAGSITGTIWNDFNGNSIRDPGDPGLPGWFVFLDDDGDGIFTEPERSTITDASGRYSFSVQPGDYTVVEILQPGWEASPGFDDSVDVTVFTEGEAIADFANFTPEAGVIRGTVWNDLDGDGSQSAAEPGLAGWTLFIDLNSNGLPDAEEPSAVSGVNGDYSIFGAPFGSSVVREVVQSGFQPTAPGTGAQLVNLLNGEESTNINFGNKQRTDGEIRGVVFVDTNRNGLRDAGERGLGGITVYIDLDDDDYFDPEEPRIVTSEDLFYTPGVDESGQYEFTHLPAGTYHIRQIVPAEQSSTPESEREHLVELEAGEVESSVDCGNVFRPNEVHGFKFNDLNGNHVRDPGEPGMPGVTIFIDLDRDNVFDASEPSTVTGADGYYSFEHLTPGAYIVREIVTLGSVQTYPTSVGGILWPTGVSNPAVGNVSPTSITASLAVGEVLNRTVSLTLPSSGALTNMVDVFLLFDDTGSFTGNSPIVRAAFPQIISALHTNLPGIDLGFGVGRLEEYANFADEYATGRPFILNQPIVSSSTPGFSEAIQSALDRTAPGYGGDQPETVFEALYQTVTGVGFDGDNNGSRLDSGAAGFVSTQINPGASGDVPPFASFTAVGPVLPASGTVGGAGFRAGALPIILTATDTGFAYQPKGETTIIGLNGATLPVSAFTQTSRPTTPFSSGAGIQQTITGLNALGALVIGLGTNAAATMDPRQGLEAIARLTGAINQSTTTIANGTADPIAPGDPLYFQIASGFGASVASGVITAIQNAVTNVNVNISLKASDPRVHIISMPGVINGVGAGQTATFDVQFTGDGVPRRFDLQFVREGTNVVLGSIPVVLGTPIPGDGYDFEDLDEGEIDDDIDFGNHFESSLVNAAPSFTGGPDLTLLEDAAAQVIMNWATDISPGPMTEAGQTVDFIITADNPSLFSVQPAITPDGTLSFTPAPNAHGAAIITVQLHDNGGTVGGGLDTSAPQNFTITIHPVADILINEALSSAADPSLNYIELFNPSPAAIDLSGWYLSDAVDSFAKFRIPDGTILEPGAYRVFHESDFNPTPASPGPDDFALSASHGNGLWLSRAEGDLEDHVQFIAAEAGISFGRVPDGDGAGEFFPNLAPTPGGANAGPRFGPVVFSEVMYHAIGGPDLDFIEIYNSGKAPVDLSGWRLSSCVDFDFPSGTTLGGRSALVILPFDPLLVENTSRVADFQAAYGVAPDARFRGLYIGDLDDAGDRLRLLKPLPEPADEPGFIPYALADEIHYSDSPPWTPQAAGAGLSLHRIAPDEYGNAPASWPARQPSPGAAPGDINRDGLIDSLDIDALYDLPLVLPADNAGDLDDDGDVDAGDVQWLVTRILGTFFGDANLNCAVSIGDLTILAEHFGSPGNWAQGDFNGDDMVSIGDLTLLAENFGSQAGASLTGAQADFAAQPLWGLQALGQPAGLTGQSDAQAKDETDPVADILGEIAEGLRD